MDVLPEDTKFEIELARFDIQRIKDPDIHGEMYQQGPQYDYENVKAYVLDRDRYKCQVCGEKDKKFHVHHIQFKSKGATDNPMYMATVCTDCHTLQAHRPGGILYQWMEEEKKFTRGLRDMTFMNILASRLQKIFYGAWFTYGNFTNYNRKRMGLPKSHINDAIAIACAGKKITKVIDDIPDIEYRQVRSKKRNLHEASPRKGRKGPNRQAKRNNKNTKEVTIRLGRKKDSATIRYHIWDKVSYNGETGWIKGFTGTSAYVVDDSIKYICFTERYKQIPLKQLRKLTRNNGWICHQKT